MNDDYLLQNAPLIEVIAEIHWQLIPLKTAPGAAVDPYFDVFEPVFREGVSKEGFSFVEELVPTDFPRELAPRQPHFRYRQRQEGWPLYQVGPGLFTANFVPPYKGWHAEVKPCLQKGIETLLSTYPLADKVMKLRQTELRYVDAFTKKHGLTEDHDLFLSKHLSIPSPVPSVMVERIEGNARTKLSISIPLKGGYAGGLRTSAGKTKDEQALILELFARHRPDGRPDAKTLTKVFDASHQMVKHWFESICSKELVEVMGPRIPLRE